MSNPLWWLCRETLKLLILSNKIDNKNATFEPTMNVFSPKRKPCLRMTPTELCGQAHIFNIYDLNVLNVMID